MPFRPCSGQNGCCTGFLDNSGKSAVENRMKFEFSENKNTWYPAQMLMGTCCSWLIACYQSSTSQNQCQTKAKLSLLALLTVIWERFTAGMSTQSIFSERRYKYRSVGDPEDSTAFGYARYSWSVPVLAYPQTIILLLMSVDPGGFLLLQLRFLRQPSWTSLSTPVSSWSRTPQTWP